MGIAYREWCEWHCEENECLNWFVKDTIWIVLQNEERGSVEYSSHAYAEAEPIVASTHLFKVLFNYSQIISAILPIPFHFWVIAADFPVFTLCEGTEKPADLFVLVRENKTKIVISTTVNANIKSVIRFLNLPPLWKDC